MVKDLKKELSKLSGVDFFNPKYRDVFKKYFPNDATESESNDNEEDRLKEVLGQEVPQDSEEPEAQEVATAEETEDVTDTETQADDEQEESADEKTDSDNSEETAEGAEESVDSSDEETSADDEETQSETESTNKEEATADETSNNTANELLETKVELQLVKSGVREDRLESAKKLFMSDIKSLEDLDKLKDLIKQYPEWLKQNKQDAKPFGMPLGDSGERLTEEEKRLKAMGINPKD